MFAGIDSPKSDEPVNESAYKIFIVVFGGGAPIGVEGVDWNEALRNLV